jgi:hypothetical protein
VDYFSVFNNSASIRKLESRAQAPLGALMVRIFLYRKHGFSIIPPFHFLNNDSEALYNKEGEGLNRSEEKT